MNGTTIIGTIAYNANTMTYTAAIDCMLKPGARLPERAHHSDAGADLFAYENLEIIQTSKNLLIRV